VIVSTEDRESAVAGPGKTTIRRETTTSTGKRLSWSVTGSDPEFEGTEGVEKERTLKYRFVVSPCEGGYKVSYKVSLARAGAECSVDGETSCSAGQPTLLCADDLLTKTRGLSEGLQLTISPATRQN
jgi:hypothetical protein